MSAESAISAKVRQDQAIAGTSRHYRGPGLGVPPPWQCDNCGQSWTSEPADGCPTCNAKARELLERPLFVPKEPPMSTPSSYGTIVRRTEAPPVSPLLQAPRTTISLDAIKQALREVLQELTTPAATPDSLPAPLLYAGYIGLQLLLPVAQEHEGTDPLLPPVSDIATLIAQLETHPTLQAYLLQAPPAAAPPPSPEPEA